MIKTQDKLKKDLPAEYNSFGLFLKIDSLNDKILKWYILDTTLHDAKNKFKLRDLRNSPRLLKMLENRIASLPKFYSLQNLILSVEEDRRLDSKLAEYLSQLPKVIYTNFIVNAVIAEKWMDFVVALKLLFEVKFYSKNTKFDYFFFQE